MQSTDLNNPWPLCDEEERPLLPLWSNVEEYERYKRVRCMIKNASLMDFLTGKIDPWGELTMQLKYDLDGLRKKYGTQVVDGIRSSNSGKENTRDPMALHLSRNL